MRIAVSNRRVSETFPSLGDFQAKEEIHGGFLVLAQYS
jgi:hypothetical protein